MSKKIIFCYNKHKHKGGKNMSEENSKIGDLKRWLGEHKKIVITALCSFFVFVILLINIGALQVAYFSMTHNPQKVVNVISKDVRDPAKQNRLYVDAGLDYLIKDLSEVSTTFLENNFLNLSKPRREEVLKAYNKKQIFMKDNKQFLGVLSKLEPLPEVYRTYIKRMSEEQLERALIEYFGQNPKLSQTVVTELYNITSAYGRKLPFNKFKFSIYDLMSFPHNGDANSVALKLLGNIKPEVIQTNLFTELKTKPIDVDELNTWVNILQKYNVITTEQFAGFTNAYGTVTQARNRYVQLERQEVDLVNMKDKVDVQTNGLVLEKEKKQQEKQVIQGQINERKKELDQYSQYQIIKLYIMDYYGDGQYEASIPEKSWFFDTYKPTNEKVVIKVTYTDIQKQGAYDFKVYNKGIHNSGLPYYVELSQADRDRIGQIESDINNLTQKLSAKEQEIATLDEEIAMIRKSQNYDEIIRGIEDVKKSMEQIVLSVEESKVKIQNIFGIGQVDISIQSKSNKK